MCAAGRAALAKGYQSSDMGCCCARDLTLMRQPRIGATMIGSWRNERTCWSFQAKALRCLVGCAKEDSTLASLRPHALSCTIRSRCSPRLFTRSSISRQLAVATFEQKEKRENQTCTVLGSDAAGVGVQRKRDLK